MKSAIATILKSSILLLALPALLAFFAWSTAVNWQVGLIRGGGAPISVPVIDLPLTAGEFLGAGLVALGWVQFIIIPGMGWAYAQRRWVELVCVALLGAVCVTTGVATGVAFQAATTDLMERRGAASLQNYNAARVELDVRSAKSLEIAPRSAAVIKAARAELLQARVTYRGKSYIVDEISAGCSRAHYAVRDICPKVLALNTELAEAAAYEANQDRLEAARQRRDEALQIDPAQLYKPFEKRLGARAEDVQEAQAYWLQAACELVSLIIIPLMMTGWRALNGHDGRGDTPPAAREVPAKVPAPPFSAEGGQPALNVIDLNAARAAASREKYHSIMEYARRSGDGQWRRVKDFMAAYRAFCDGEGMTPLAQNVVGAVLLQCGGEREVVYERRSYGTTPVTYWRIGQDEAQHRSMVA